MKLAKVISLSVIGVIGGSLLVYVISALDNIAAYSVSKVAVAVFVLASFASAPISVILCAIEWMQSRTLTWSILLLVVSLLILGGFAVLSAVAGDVGN